MLNKNKGPEGINPEETRVSPETVSNISELIKRVGGDIQKTKEELPIDMQHLEATITDGAVTAELISPELRI